MRAVAYAEVVQNGDLQHVRLPLQFQLKAEHVRVSQDGNRIVLEPMVLSGEEWLASLEEFGDQPFMPEGREQPPFPERAAIDD